MSIHPKNTIVRYMEPVMHRDAQPMILTNDGEDLNNISN